MTQTASLPSEPHMDSEGLSRFKAALEKSTCYLEYGCGGSTQYACNVAQVATVVSVDTSKPWVEMVASSVAKSASRTILNYCDLGPVGDWGTPVDRQKIDEFWRYPAAPWQTATLREAIPDTVLIDGRFRVASFLYSLSAARVGTTILFDDYFDRPRYHVVERFCRITERHGRMAVFVAQHAYAETELLSALARATTDWS